MGVAGEDEKGDGQKPTKHVRQNELLPPREPWKNWGYE
jgi:hypothetical protein